MTITHDELREGVRATFYPAIPLVDKAGQERVDRATVRLLEAIEQQRLRKAAAA